MTHLATLVQRQKRLGHFIGIHQRIGTVNQQHVEMVGRQVAQRFLGAGDNMALVGNIVADRVFRERGGGNSAFGYDLHPIAQLWCKLQGLAKRGLALVAAIDIGVINRGHPQIQMLFDKTQQLASGLIPLHQSPVTHYET